MKKQLYIKSLFRSPLKTLLTLLLLAASAFLFLYNLAEYDIARREYLQTADQYQGVLTVEQSTVDELIDPRYNFFILTDETNPGRTFDRFSYEDFHHESLAQSTIEALSQLPYITRVDCRYLTAGLSDEYRRMDNDLKCFNYGARCILVGTLTANVPARVAYTGQKTPHIEDSRDLTIKDVQMLAGDESWLENRTEQSICLCTLKESSRDQYSFYAAGNNLTRFAASTWDLGLFEDTLEQLEIGRRYLFVLRNEAHYGGYHQFLIGDDTRAGWWPYIYDVTELPEGWLETEEFAPLRDLIQVTNDDLHTFDVVYTDDMASIRRVANERILCMEGRFLEPDDAGQPVCVVSTAFLEQNDLAIGDKLKLHLGDYLCEQYAPLGAVASTKGRYASTFTEAEFTIVGSYLDLNDGKHVNRDYYWCYSDNTIFVPSAFLPDSANTENHSFKPGELSFVVENAENIVPFIEECLPQVEQMGLIYDFQDGGWPKISEQLRQAQSLALMKLMIFSGAAVFAILLSVWLFISRKRKEYGILRALGMNVWGASQSLFIPFAILGVLASLLGGVAAALVSNGNLEKGQHLAETVALSAVEPLRFGLFMLGVLAFLVLLLCFAGIGILRLRRKSILRLIQGEGSK